MMEIPGAGGHPGPGPLPRNPFPSHLHVRKTNRSTCLFTALPQVRVVILGQDPYFNPNQAHGLCFSVNKGVRVPPSLINIYKVRVVKSCWYHMDMLVRDPCLDGDQEGGR